ncbi:MAG TPA: MOSC domain-containing protein [Chthoniobacterales bacterium]
MVVGEVLRIFISPGHNFFGHHGKPAGQHPVEAVDAARCVADAGIVGDRFFEYKPAYKGQITFFECETFNALAAALAVSNRGPEVLRRNVITQKVRLNDLIGREFSVDGVRLRGREECRPCYWMNQAFGPGAEMFLKGQGGLRAEILSDGEIRVGSRLTVD